MGQPTILLGTSEFAAKTRTELRTWGLPDTHALFVPHRYQDLPEAHFAELLHHLVQDIVTLVRAPS